MKQVSGHTVDPMVEAKVETADKDDQAHFWGECWSLFLLVRVPKVYDFIPVT